MCQLGKEKESAEVTGPGCGERPKQNTFPDGESIEFDGNQHISHSHSLQLERHLPKRLPITFHNTKVSLTT
jgi:hypothetical protein